MDVRQYPNSKLTLTCLTGNLFKEVFYKKDVLKYSAKFTEKQLYQNLFLNKVTSPRSLRLAHIAFQFQSKILIKQECIVRNRRSKISINCDPLATLALLLLHLHHIYPCSLASEGTIVCSGLKFTLFYTGTTKRVVLPKTKGVILAIYVKTQSTEKYRVSVPNMEFNLVCVFPYLN